MFKISLLLIIALFSLLSCESPVDNGELAEAKEKWRSFNIKNYIIKEKRFCECMPPNEFLATIINNEVTEVEYNAPLNDSRTKEELDNYVKSMALTIDEAFGLIEKHKNAYKVEIAYDEKYGYPKNIYIDIDEKKADEEINFVFMDLKPL